MHEINTKTTEISTIIDSDVDILQLQENIINGFEKVFKANFLVNDFETISH